MSKTAAERQAEYRARRAFAGADGNGERRLNTWISTSAKLALMRLSNRYGVTERAIIEKLLAAEDERVLAELAGDEEQWQAYVYRKELRSNETESGTTPEA